MHLLQRPTTVVSSPKLLEDFGLGATMSAHGSLQDGATPPIFNREEQKIAQLAYEEIRKLETLPSSRELSNPAQQAKIIEAVQSRWQAPQLELGGHRRQARLLWIIARSVELVQRQTIDIPRILVVPRGEVRAGFKPFKLDLRRLKLCSCQTKHCFPRLCGQARSARIGRWLEAKINETDWKTSLSAASSISTMWPMTNMQSLLYELSWAGRLSTLTLLSEDDARKVLQVHRKEIARLVHAQMQQHYLADGNVEYDVKVSRGFTALKQSAYTANAGDTLDFRISPPDKSNMARYVFSGFQKCLYGLQKFQSDAERRLAIILDRETEKWFKPAKDQFQLYYRRGMDDVPYQPDFVAESKSGIYMLEPKSSC